MKSFSSFISEKRTDLPGGNPTNMPQGDIDALRRQAAGGPREPLSTDAPQRRVIRKRIIRTPEGNIETNIPPDSPRTPEEQITRAERGRTRLSSRTQQIAGDVRANPSSSPEARRAASNLLGGVPDTEPRVGTGVRSGTGAAYRANQPPKALGDKIDKLVTSIQQNARTPQRMSAAYDRNLAARANAVIRGLGDERRAETAAGNREFRQLRYGRGRSGPATTLRTPSQSSKWLEGITKGYFNPRTGKPTASGIQKHINMRAVGGVDFGKFKASGGDPRAALANVQNAITRAAGGDRAARREVKRSYKSLTTNYRPPEVIRNTPAPTPVKQSEVSKRAAAFRQSAKPAPTPSSPAASTGGGSSTPSTSTLTPTKTKQTLKLALGSPPTSAPAATKPTPAPAAQKPLPKLNLDKYKVKPLDPIKPVIATSSNYKPITTVAQKPLSTDKIADAVVKASKQVRADIATEKAAERSKIMKGLGTAGKVLGAVQTGIEAKKGYDIAKAMGSSERRSLGAGAARAFGTAAGGVVGGVLGSVAGPIGSAAGAAAGVTVGAQLGSRAYDAITGDPKKKVTTQGVLTNIRKAVPQEIRAQVPANLRKGFTDFVKSAGRTYGNWQRSQQQGANK